MNSKIRHGTPTLYRGIMFRSRLEAAWCAFCDAANWSIEYEPLDLAGYIPDFIARFYKPLLIEVKPEIDAKTLAADRQKIERSGWEHEAMIVLGAPSDILGGAPVIGIFGERVDMPRELAWEWSAARLFTCLSCGSLSVLAEDGSWRCRVCGVDGGNAHVGLVNDGLREWDLAKNRVQWRKGT